MIRLRHVIAACWLLAIATVSAADLFLGGESAKLYAAFLAGPLIGTTVVFAGYWVGET